MPYDDIRFSWWDDPDDDNEGQDEFFYADEYGDVEIFTDEAALLKNIQTMFDYFDDIDKSVYERPREMIRKESRRFRTDE